MARDKKCPQCAETVKAEAKICRFCSYQFPAPPSPVRTSGKKCLSCGSLNFFGAKTCEKCATPFPPPSKGSQLAGCLIIIAIIGAISAIARNVSNRSGADPIASESASTEAADDIQQMAVFAGASLKKAMRDPDSLVIERALGRTEKHGATYICVSYRGNNGFGGKDRAQTVFSLVGLDQSAHAWNKHCVGDGFRDEAAEVEMGVKMGPN